MSRIRLRHRDVPERVAELAPEARVEHIPNAITHRRVEPLAHALDDTLPDHGLLHPITELSQPLLGRISMVRRSATSPPFVGMASFTEDFNGGW
ncbi:MAG TPA: hypothetical protein VGJ18_10805 [Gemmatimonadaceae bacterium]